MTTTTTGESTTSTSVSTTSPSESTTNSAASTEDSSSAINPTLTPEESFSTPSKAPPGAYPLLFIRSNVVLWGGKHTHTQTSSKSKKNHCQANKGFTNTYFNTHTYFCFVIFVFCFFRNDLGERGSTWKINEIHRKQKK